MVTGCNILTLVITFIWTTLLSCNAPLWHPVVVYGVEPARPLDRAMKWPPRCGPRTRTRFAPVSELGICSLERPTAHHSVRSCAVWQRWDDRIASASRRRCDTTGMDDRAPKGEAPIRTAASEVTWLASDAPRKEVHIDTRRLFASSDYGPDPLHKEEPNVCENETQPT
jgi:hypothetical protein